MRGPFTRLAAKIASRHAAYHEDLLDVVTDAGRERPGKERRLLDHIGEDEGHKADGHDRALCEVEVI
jgi:hypothetical protein